MRYIQLTLLLAVVILVSSCKVNTVVDEEMSIRLTDPVPWMLRGVVLDLGNSGEQDDKSIESPLIIKSSDGTYIMWYRGQTYADNIGRVMRATSTDGINWVKRGVVMVPEMEYEGNTIDPMAIMFEDNIYKMWYGGDTLGGCACYATSPDGVNWTRYERNPVLMKDGESWDKSGAGGQHTVIKNGSKYFMYYKGYSDKEPGWTFYGLAESDDGVNWKKQGKVISPNPALGETTTFRNLYAFKVDQYFCIMHTMVQYLNLSLRTSLDGINWKNHGMVFLHGQTPGRYDVKWATSPCVLVDGDVIKMWYEGGDINGRVRVLYAEVNKQQFLQECRNSYIRIP